MSEYRKYALDGFEQEPMPALSGRVLRQFVSGEQMTVARVAFDEGSEMAEHWHANEQFTVLLSGQMEFTVAGEKVAVSAGEVLFLPSNVPHSARSLTDAVLLDVFSPPRADWKRAD
jgi:quercetin dioxygenase-like cupin family protein